MNIKLWDALMKSDFVFDRESYLVLRQSCFHLLQHNAPELLNLKEDNVIDFLSQAGKSLEVYYNANLRFDSMDYLCQLENSDENSPEQRKSVYLHAIHHTFEQKMVMLFVALMGIYASWCDDDDDFWEPYGLSGHYVCTKNDFLQMFEKNCLTPLNDKSNPHFDRRLAVSLSALYSLAVTLIGINQFGLHLHNFFHYIRQKEKLKIISEVHNPTQTH